MSYFLNFLDPVSHQVHFQLLLHDEIALLHEFAFIGFARGKRPSFVLFDFLGFFAHDFSPFCFVEVLESHVHDFLEFAFVSCLAEVNLLFFLDELSFFFGIFEILGNFLSFAGIGFFNDGFVRLFD